MRRFHELLQALRATDADVLCLQELWFHPDTLSLLAATLEPMCVPGSARSVAGVTSGS